MEITDLEYQQMQDKIAQQQRELDTLKGKDADEQVREYLQQRREQESNKLARCEQIRQSFK